MALTFRTSRRSADARRSNYRPLLEALEDRLAPATFTVNSTLDTVAASLVTGLDATGKITLRSAIQAANSASNPGDDIIVVPAGTFTLTLAGTNENAAATGDLDVIASGKLTITGAGASATMIDAGDRDRVFEVRTNANLELFGMTVRGGNAGNGGGILNGATLTVSGCTLVGNSASDQGGGIFNSGTATVNGSTLAANSANQNGGGIFNSGTATVSGSTLTGNSAGSDGGGIRNFTGATLTVSDSTLAGNSAGSDGGGIDNFNFATATVSSSTLAANSAGLNGGGIRNFTGATLTVSDSTLAGNSAGSDGGGIDNFGTATVGSSTLAANSAGLNGGGIRNFTARTLTVSDSTLSGNSANAGGGIDNQGTLTVSGSTLAGNSANNDGGGINTFGPLTVRNSILAGNTAGVLGPDVRGSATSNGNNLIGNTAGSSGFGAAGDLLNVDPRLGPLANNGGRTLTHALQAGSPAFDAGNNTGAAPLDQRGFNRLVDGPDANTTATSDIGAFEAQIWMADIADQATNEDTVLAINFATSLGIANVTAISSNPALVPDPNLRVTGAGAGRVLTITPVANQHGPALITVTVSDGTSSMTDTFLLIVNPANDAPVLDNSGVMTLQAINEDDTSSFGTRVSDLIQSAALDRITDVDAGAVEGVAVTAVDNTNGAWQFSTDSAATFTSFGAASATEARLLAAGAFVRFVPNADFNGVSSFSFRAWDQTGGANGGTADTSTSGGVTPFSTASEIAQITILPVNDAPKNTVPAAQTTSLNKPLRFSATRLLSIADVDAGSGIVRVTLTVTKGILKLGTLAGLTSVSGNGTVKITLTGTVAALNTALSSLRYKPTPAFRGKAKLTIFTEDLGNSGLGGAKTDNDVVSIAVV